MSKVIHKKNHWITKVHEFAVSQDACEQLNLELFGGAENGEFPYMEKSKRMWWFIKTANCPRSEEHTSELQSR